MIRNSRRLVLVAVSALLLTSCGNGGSSIAQESYISGDGAVTFISAADRQMAPKLSGDTLYGTRFNFAGNQIAVLNVWASWCSPCRAEIPTLNSLSQKYKDVQFMGILTRDNLANAEVFARQLAVPYPNFIDDSLLLGFRNTLPANAIPTTVVIDKQGRVAARISGPATVAGLSNLIERLTAE
ncbi:MAG: TlpA disulfide reductase family protein [Actinobacteria bacterium]|nr:TlpA disulfide reductase family protein [Actinomycetota bacterium]